MKWIPIFERSVDRHYTRDIYIKLVALLGFSAFLSLHLQLDGLVGEKGILPIVQGLQGLISQQGWWAFFRHPSLLVFWPSNFALTALGYLGMGASLLLLMGFLPRVMLFLMWLFYLSMALAGQNFTSYQWDILLLETFFYTIAVAPATIMPNDDSWPPARLGLLLLNLLLFKLMFLGGAAKLMGGDSTWWNLTALDYHFFTQPLPNPISWYANLLPGIVLKAGTVFTLIVEIVVPFFLFFPRLFRLTAVYLIAALQILIMVTGNYGPFNLNALVLCFLQLDDPHLANISSSITDRFSLNSDNHETSSTIFPVVLALVLIVFNGIYFTNAWTGSYLPQWARSSVRFVGRFNTINTYGLFANMTTKRREIIIQGSRNGESWESYSFPYKPGPVDRRPPVVQLHMPRLDWQMWFAALKPPQRVKWFPPFLYRVLQGSDSVLGLLERNPFPEEPPNYVRAIMYRYRFTSWEEGQRTGHWWKRSKPRIYYPPVELKGGKLRRARF